MKNDLAWKDNSSAGLLQYDFAPPNQWTRERVAAEQEAIANLVEGSNAKSASSAPAWLRLAMRLPDALRAALVIELRAGNQLTGIGSTGWPTESSVVVNLRERFSTVRQAPPSGVAWRELNDPHYCREELSQKVDSVEFLIIT